jgi:hypothetical protein
MCCSQAVEGCLSGLEVAQGENIRRLSLSLNSALADAEATLQVSVRSEVSQSLDPIRRLPSMLAAMLPATSGSGFDPSVPGLASGNLATEAAMQAAMRVAVSEEVAAAVQQILLAQVRRDKDGMVTPGGVGGCKPPRPQSSGFHGFCGARPIHLSSLTGHSLVFLAQSEGFSRVSQQRGPEVMVLVDEQWEALGKRLSRIERLVEAVPEVSPGSSHVLLLRFKTDFLTCRHPKRPCARSSRSISHPLWTPQRKPQLLRSG